MNANLYETFHIRIYNVKHKMRLQKKKDNNFIFMEMLKKKPLR